MRPVQKLLACSVLCLGASGVWADTLDLPATPTTPAPAAATAKLPVRGESMAVVQRQYGEPTLKHKPAGGGSRKHPPITRWDYPAFSVFFERGTVIDTVVPSQPPQLHNVQDLKPAPPTAAATPKP